MVVGEVVPFKGLTLHSSSPSQVCSDSSSLTAAGGAILQCTEDIPSYWWDSDND